MPATPHGPKSAAFHDRSAELVAKLEAELLAAGADSGFHPSIAGLVSMTLAVRFVAASLTVDARSQRREVRQSEIESTVIAFRSAVKVALERIDAELAPRH